MSDTAASPQGGVFDGLNPIMYSEKAPYNLFIIQTIIILVLCRILHVPLSYLGQPKVIAEILAGIILGPSIMMRIPGFKDNIFPDDSMPVLTNVANLGLLLFLFLIGVEVETNTFRHNWKVALSVGLLGMTIPFGLGYAIAWGLYNEYGVDDSLDSVSFGVYGLFIGTALAITAFPVLCRILSELQLLNTSVGLTVLAAGVGNDVVGWVLLALCVALVNNSSGIVALYVFLTAAGWVLFLVFLVRPCFMWLLRRTGSLQNGPSQGIVALTLIMVLISAWFTSAIGIHIIFGAFLMGIILSNETRFSVKLVEKIEDLVTVLLLPLYFALSGLSTNLGLLDDGTTWAYVFGVIAIAFFGKLGGGLIAARLNRLLWRESLAVGLLMSCKGLVELIVLNIGLEAGILSTRTFTIFVVMALVTTVATSPLTRWAYPIAYRKKVEKWRRGEIDWDGNSLHSETRATDERMAKVFDKTNTSRLLVHLRLDTLSSMFGLISLLGESEPPVETNSSAILGQEKPAASDSGNSPTASPKPPQAAPVEVHGVRLVELTDRVSSVMQSADLDDFAARDFVITAFKTFSQLHGVAVAGHIAAVPSASYAETLVEKSKDAKTDMMLIPWSSHGTLTDEWTFSLPGESGRPEDRFYSRQHIDFVQRTIDRATCTLAVFIGRLADQSPPTRPTLAHSKTGLSVRSARSDIPTLLRPSPEARRIFVPFIGGRDDQAAVFFALQLARSSRVVVTIAHVTFSNGDSLYFQPGPSAVPESSGSGDKVIVKEVVDEPSASDHELLSSARKLVSSHGLDHRVKFMDVSADSPSRIPGESVKLASTIMRKASGNVDDIIILGRHHRCLDRRADSDRSLESEFERTIGVLGAQFARASLEADLLVMHAPADEIPTH